MGGVLGGVGEVGPGQLGGGRVRPRQFALEAGYLGVFF